MPTPVIVRPEGRDTTPRMALVFSLNETTKKIFACPPNRASEGTAAIVNLLDAAAGEGWLSQALNPTPTAPSGVAEAVVAQALNSTPVNEDVLEEALRITKGDRQNQYGPPDQDFQRTAAMWSALKGVQFTAQDVAAFMIVLKLSRQTHQNKRDNWVDIAGYARCGSLCRKEATGK